MEPADITILAIQNPGDAEATIVNPQSIISPDTAIEQWGNQLKQGAFVSLTDRSPKGNTVRVRHFVVNRVGNTVYLQNNERIAETHVCIDDIGSSQSAGYAPLAPDPDPADLETFTVFGNNDDNEDFVAVVTATEDTVHDVGVQAGLVDKGYESDVDIVLVVKGDQSDLECIAA